LLQSEGVGTDRNIGNGAFMLKSGKIEIDLPVNCKYAMSLSIFIPENQEQLKDMLSGENVAYDFTRRGGWITNSPYNTIRKKYIHAFLPASVFLLLVDNFCIKGQTVNLRPDLKFQQIPYPIWRNGKSIFIPINI